MKKVAIFTLAIVSASTLLAQSVQKTTELSVLDTSFVPTEQLYQPASYHLQEVAKYEALAAVTPVITGISMCGFGYGLSKQPDDLGFMFGFYASAGIGLVLETMWVLNIIDHTSAAGKALERIEINSNGVTIKF